MAASQRAAYFERHVAEFIQEWRAESVLETYVRNRMLELGVRRRQIGIVDDVETGTAFSMEHGWGGRNARPTWASGVTKGGINLDYGILDPDLVSGSAMWRTASLRDRIDAVIIHELTEYNSRAATTALRHLSAIRRAPLTLANISPKARRILEEHRALSSERQGGEP